MFFFIVTSPTGIYTYRPTFSLPDSLPFALHENGLLALCDLFALLDDPSIGRCRILDAETARPLDSDRIKIVERLMLIIGTRGEWNIAGDGAIKQIGRAHV